MARIEIVDRKYSTSILTFAEAKDLPRWMIVPAILHKGRLWWYKQTTGYAVIILQKATQMTPNIDIDVFWYWRVYTFREWQYEAEDIVKWLKDEQEFN